MSGRSLEAAPINEPAIFHIDPSAAPYRADARVKIEGPSPLRRPIPYDIRGDFVRGWTVEWTPRDLGVHSLDVRYGTGVVTGSPFRCKVFDLSKVELIRDDDAMDARVDLDGIPGDDIVFFGRCSADLLAICTKHTLLL